MSHAFTIWHLIFRNPVKKTMAAIQKITPSLWFDSNAEEAVNYYVSIFKNSSIKRTSHYTKAGQEIHKQKPGSVLTIEFELEGQNFVALNGGPVFKFSEAISFVVNCKTQKEIDFYWDKLSKGGDPSAQQCGWLKDKFGLSWQIVPEILADLMASSDSEKTERAMDAMLKMKKIDIEELEAATSEVGKR
jgi:predicted 3-demethylubiquinone-9 3-methyltransferase (glyoxalase superfamily)